MSFQELRGTSVPTKRLSRNLDFVDLRSGQCFGMTNEKMFKCFLFRKHTWNHAIYTKTVLCQADLDAPYACLTPWPQFQVIRDQMRLKRVSRAAVTEVLSVTRPNYWYPILDSALSGKVTGQNDNQTRMRSESYSRMVCREYTVKRFTRQYWINGQCGHGQCLLIWPKPSLFNSLFIKCD